MSQRYSRKAKQTASTPKRRPTEHLKRGLTAFQKTLAFVGSILSVVVATITITNYVNSKKGTTDDKTSPSTIIIHSNNGQAESTNTSQSENTDSYQTDQTNETNTNSSSEASSENSPTTSVSTETTASQVENDTSTTSTP